MVDIIVPMDKEKSVYLTQIQYLEEQLERCQLDHDRLQRQNEELTSRYGALEKDKMDTTRRLKRRVDAKETEERELTERLQSQQQAAERLRQNLKLQHGCEMKELQRRLEDLQSESEELANKSRQQQELKERLDLLEQQRSDRETKTKLLVGHNKKLEAAIDCWKREAEPERRRKIADREKEIDRFTETKTVRILQSDRAAHVKRLEELSFLLDEKVTLLRERDVLRDQKRDHCSERDRWKTDVMKNAKELFSCKKEFGQMQNECQRLRAELKDCSSAYEDVLARKVTLRRLLAAASERSCQQTAEAARLGAELQRESREGGRLQAVREEGVVLLRHVLTDSEEASETEQMMLRLLDILESSAPPKGTRLHPKPLPRGGRERTDPETSQQTGGGPESLQGEDHSLAGGGPESLQKTRGSHVGEPEEDMELYLDLRSQPCRSVFLFARAVGIPFEFKLVDLTKGQQYTEEFGDISAVRKVPVMKDGDFVLTESTAILKYLVQKHRSSVKEHWFPEDLQQRARVNEYLSWQHMNLRAHGSKVFLLKALFPVVMGYEVAQEKMEAALEDLNQSLRLLEEKFLQSRAFLIGEKISLADLVAIVEIMQPVGVGVDVFGSRPRLAAWRDRVKDAIGERLFDEGHEKVMKTSGLGEEMKSSSQLGELGPKLRKLFS